VSETSTSEQGSPGQRGVRLPFPGIRVGVGEDPTGPTGCTVLDFGSPVRVARDPRGGSVCWSGDFPSVHALCLAGGSVYGLEAISGVAAELLHRRGDRVHWSDLALVSGACAYDFASRSTSAYPTMDLGRAALLDATTPEVPVGRRGAGSATLVGAGIPGLQPEPGGQGAAAAVLGELAVAVVTVVNALGAVRDREGRVVRGHLDPATGLRHRAVDRAASTLTAPPMDVPAGNTTLTVLVTNARLDDRALTQLGRQVHGSMARAIEPFSTLYDGDLLWAVTTDDGPAGLDVSALGTVASELAWDAVLSAVR